MEDVFGPRSDEFKGQGHQGQKRYFSALSAACVPLMFGRTSLVSSLTVFMKVKLASYWTVNSERVGRVVRS